MRARKATPPLPSPEMAAAAAATDAKAERPQAISDHLDTMKDRIDELRKVDALIRETKDDDLAVTLCGRAVFLCDRYRTEAVSLGLTALEDVRMRANAAIAVDDPRP